MRNPPRLRDTSGIAFLAYVALTFSAWSTAFVTERELRVALEPLAEGDDALFEPGGAILVEALQRLYVDHGPTLVLTLLGGAIAALLVGPLLAVAWLRALRTPTAPLTALRGAGTVYLPTLALLVVFGLLGLVAAGAGALLPFGAHRMLRAGPHPVVHDVAVGFAALLGALPVAAIATWHDLARAFLADGTTRVPQAIRHSFPLLDARMLGAYLGWLGLGATLALASPAVTFALDDGATFASPMVATVVGQAVLFGRLLVRGRWLRTAARAAEGSIHARN